jgi:hypothetical protein
VIGPIAAAPLALDNSQYRVVTPSVHHDKIHTAVNQKCAEDCRNRNLPAESLVPWLHLTKGAGLLMETGTTYNKDRLHGKAYFSELLGSLQEVPRSVVELLQLSRGQVEFFAAIQRRLLQALRKHPELSQRVMRLQSIPSVGEIVALSWALEVGEVGRFPSIAQAVSYCGLTSAQHSSAGKEQRGPISKQRNRHLQTILLEAAKLAPRHNPQLAAVHQRELSAGRQGDQGRSSSATTT